MSQPDSPQPLILTNRQCPGDIVMLTAAVRDLHRAYPGRYVTDVRTTAESLWDHNPHLTRLDRRDSDARVLEMHCPLIHHSNQRPCHFLHGFTQHLENKLGLRIPVTEFKGDIYLSDEERNMPSQLAEAGHDGEYWVIVAGGKFDFTAKWWDPVSFQAVVDHFQGRIQFVQCGELDDWHPKLTGVIDLRGRTDLRQFVRVIYHAAGVLCPVTLAMHLAAAVPTLPGKPPSRACVVIAGGREPPHWEAYPTHQFIHTVGALECCQQGGCWKSRCQLVGDGDPKDEYDVCVDPVQLTPQLRIPRCMDMITPGDVIRRIELFLAHPHR